MVGARPGRVGEGGVTGLLQAVVAAMAIAHGAVAQPIDDGSGRDRPELDASSQVGRTALFAAQTGGPDDEPLDGQPVDRQPAAQEPAIAPAADAENLDQGAPLDDAENLDQGPVAAAPSGADEELLDQGPPPTTSAPVPAAAAAAPVPAAPPAASAPAPATEAPVDYGYPTGGKPVASAPKSTWPFDSGGGVFVNAGFGPSEASAAQGFDSCKQRVSNGRAYVGVNCAGADVVSGFTPPPWQTGTVEAAQTVIRPASALSPSEWQPSSSPGAANPDNAAESTNAGNAVFKEGKSRTRTRTITMDEDGDAVAEDDRGDDGNGASTRSSRTNKDTSQQPANRNNGSNGGNGNNNGNKASSEQKAGESGKKDKSKSKKKDRRADRKKAKQQDRRTERQATRQDERRAEGQDRRAANDDERGSASPNKRSANDRASCRDRAGDGGNNERTPACRDQKRTSSDS